ncbi:blast:BPTI/Kunitz domain-containing protein [Drosophila guanche]|uniref:Blast:BPTI/Kunitz domain-containing protein n=2 Tax=Drosophila guanche TaxID=7266 RepID=A0A3B0KHM1_DROGU|nr:blast:BPTI/Kunitz domain-containing protein [Drosophila guanche]
MERHPNLIAQISATEKTVLTRAEVRLNAIRVVSYMRGLGLKQTDIVGLIARSTTHLVAVAYACFFNGMPPRLIFCDGDEYESVLTATETLKLEELARPPWLSLSDGSPRCTNFDHRISDNFRAAPPLPACQGILLHCPAGFAADSASACTSSDLLDSVAGSAYFHTSIHRIFSNRTFNPSLLRMKFILVLACLALYVALISAQNNCRGRPEYLRLLSSNRTFNPSLLRMKFILVLACLALYVALISAQNNCRGRPARQLCTGGRNEGHRRHRSCQASFMPEMWWYNARVRDCQKMRYLGCGGNNNRYCSLASCRRQCRRR